MKLELHWRGPFGAGYFPQSDAGMQELLRAGVYLRLKCYARGRNVAYVGQSKQVLARIDQHIGAVLGLTHGLRDDAGRVVFTPAFDARLRALNDIERVAGLALAEARRMRFFCAFCDDGFDSDFLGLVEYLLMLRLADGGSGGEAENINRPPVVAFDSEVIVESDLGAIAPKDQKLLRGLIGEAPLRVAETVG
ncbi:MAG: GIY-YIG nuclease family protein [Alphaproteobacteria bacterium]|jgi:hypothetical protein|nr:GIY-YIG nuclease family protein [Alphaproteobacteria bacterium]MDP6587961.1 GIY-YIG nuclease family protein [Alphaproteobacteria bacterium]MDP6817780.1 GIY-YIG nuclease family protein [Alphaproteobacteria bacterium]